MYFDEVEARKSAGANADKGHILALDSFLYAMSEEWVYEYDYGIP